MRRPALLLAFAVMISSLLGLMTMPAYAATPPAPASSVAKPFVDQDFTLTGSLGTAGVRPLELQKYSSSKWSKDKSGQAAADGSYSFTTSTTASSRRYRVYAKANGPDPAVTSDELTVTTQVDEVSLVVSRSGDTGTADGVASPKITGRLFALQYKSGSAWKQIGAKVAEDAAGKLRFTFVLDASRTYRLQGDPVAGSASVTPALRSTYSGEIDWLQDWYGDRFEWMDNQLS